MEEIDKMVLDQLLIMPRGRRIRALRKLRDLSQEELGQLTGRTRATISDLELRDVEPKLTTAHALADALGVPVDTITAPSPEED